MSNRNHNQDSVEQDDDNAVFVEPNIEHELSRDKRQACRDIALEIKNFGVNQRQILFLIQLLTMELENGDAMRTISKAIGTVRKDIAVGNKLVLPETATAKKKLVF